jgi:hypothetical protein
LYEAGGIEQFKTPIAHPTDANHLHYGYLPLHVLINSFWRFPSDFNPASETVDMFRWLLQLHPEAAGIKGGGGANRKSTYRQAVDESYPSYYLRLLLRATPTLNPARLHRLNYKERRMTMFLAFKAISGTLQAPLLVRLRGESKDLVQRVVSFL